MLKKFKSLFGAQDMTVGSTFTCLIRFAIPLLIGNIAQLLYSTADAFVVGRYMGELGDVALSAIGSAMPPCNFFLVLFMGVGSGVTVMVSQYYGAKDYDNLGVSIGNSISMIVILSIFITTAASSLAGPILRLVSTPTETFEMAKSYMTIIFLGSIGIGLYNALSSILRGLGESVFPLIVLLTTVILNIFLDILFVAGFNMGVAGAAFATVISQVLSAVICIIKVVRMRKFIRLSLPMLKPVKRVVIQIIALGGPNAVSMAIMFASIMFVQSLVNSMGYMVVTAITVTQRLDSFAMLPSQTFQNSAGTFTGQNIGAGKMDRVRQGTKTVFLMCLVITSIMVASMLLFGRYMLGLFTKTESVINMSMTFVRIMTPAYILMTLTGSLSGVMRGAGDTMGPMWITMVNNVLLRVPLAYLFAYLTRSDQNPKGNPNSIFLSMLSAMVVGSVLTILYFRAGKWKEKSVVRKRSPSFDVG